MIRHLIPRATWSGWQGDALTVDPNGGVEMPAGLVRSFREARGLPTVTRECDEVKGGIVCVQWLGIMVEIAVGRVLR